MTTTTPDAILNEAEASMKKAIEYLGSELRGIRTGRASTALVEYVKVDYYGSPTDLNQLASTVLGGGLGRGTLSFEKLGKQIPGAGSLFR